MSARIASTAPVWLSSLSKAKAEVSDLLTIDVGHPGVQFDELEVRWYRDTYRIDDGRLVRVARVLTRSSRADFRP